MPFSPAQFFEESKDLLFVLGPEGALAKVNPAFSALLGRDPASLEGRPFASFAAASSVPFFVAALSDAKKGIHVHFQTTLRAEDGSERTLEVSGSPSPSSGLVHCVGRLVEEEPEAEPALTRDGSLQGIVQKLCDTLGVDQAYISSALGWPVDRVKVVAGIHDGKAIQPFEYCLEDTPCFSVLRGEVCHIDAGVQRAFPNDEFLSETKAECYLGVPVINGIGIIFGHVCIADKKPVPRGAMEQRLETLRAAARSAIPELARLRMEATLLHETEPSDAQGEALYNKLVRQIAEALQVDIVFVTQFDDPPTSGVILSLWDRGVYEVGVPYQVDNTPCGVIVRGDVCQIKDHMTEHFPGQPFYIERKLESCVAVPIVDSKGKTIGSMGVLDTRPMTGVEERALALKHFAARAAAEMERARAARIAAESDARFRLLVEHAADMLFVHTPEGIVLDCNRAAMQALGRGREELVGKHLSELVENIPAEEFSRVGATLRVGEPRTFEAKFLRADGTSFPTEVRTVLFEQGNQKIVLSSGRDVTEQRKAAAMLESALAALSTPIIEVWDGTLALPVIGTVDRARAARMTLALLEAIAEKQAEFAILDLTGVTTVDAETANHLLDIAKAASLLGSDCLVSGVAPAVARTLVELGAVEGTAFKTYATLQSALRYALGRRGVKVSKR